MKKYLTRDYGNPITLVEVERETESSVWIDGRQRRKYGDDSCYCDTFDEAKSHVIRIAAEKLSRAQRQVLAFQTRLDAAQSLKECGL